MPDSLHDLHPNPKNQAAKQHLVFVVLVTILFTLAYAQSPLYTSNQNQYFLHAMAKAGLGNLNQDWLANTLDPTPVFSGIIYLIYTIIPWPTIFYIIFGGLAGIFIWSLYSIAIETFKIRQTPARQWFFITALIGINSAAVRYLVVRIFNADWAYLFDGGVAGQRILGSVLQPSACGVLLLLSIHLFLQKKYGWAVFFVVLTPTIHPTYLLSAAVLTLVYMGIFLFEKKEIRAPLILGGSAILGVIPILAHTLITFGGTSPDTTAWSRELLVDFRIPHHAIPAEWFDGSVIVKTIFILAALYLTRKTRLFHILCWPFLTAALGTLAQILTQNNVLALLFPWRISTWLVPISVSILALFTTDQLWGWISKRIPPKNAAVMSLTISVLLAGSGMYKFSYEQQEKETSADRPVMVYVKENKSQDNLYLIPLHMQDFRLETGAPAYVEFKSIPYQDVDVVEWHRRVRLTGKFYQAPLQRTGCRAIDELFTDGVTHVVMPYDHIAARCENLQLQYQDFDYEVYLITDLP